MEKVARRNMILWSFSLYGSDKTYIAGAVENAVSVRNMGEPNKAIFYCGKDVSIEVINTLTSNEAIVKVEDESWHPNGMFWRFSPILDFTFSYLLIRDVDSRISPRELKAVQEWINSGKMGHIMRDHPFHRTKILGGMWGVTEKFCQFTSIFGHMSEFGLEKGEDQRFLSSYVYNKLMLDCLVHDSFFSLEKDSKHFSTPRINGEYIGETIYSSGQFDKGLREFLIRVEGSRLLRFWYKHLPLP